jgi:hypothetical protein
MTKAKQQRLHLRQVIKVRLKPDVDLGEHVGRSRKYRPAIEKLEVEKDCIVFISDDQFVVVRRADIGTHITRIRSSGTIDDKQLGSYAAMAGYSFIGQVKWDVMPVKEWLKALTAKKSKKAKPATKVKPAKKGKARRSK